MVQRRNAVTAFCANFTLCSGGGGFNYIHLARVSFVCSSFSATASGQSVLHEKKSTNSVACMGIGSIGNVVAFQRSVNSEPSD